MSELDKIGIRNKKEERREYFADHYMPFLRRWISSISYLGNGKYECHVKSDRWDGEHNCVTFEFYYDNNPSWSIVQMLMYTDVLQTVIGG